MSGFYPAFPFVPHFHHPETGALASGYRLEAYFANTSTPTDLYIDRDGTSAGSSIVLNAAGEPEVDDNVVSIWLDIEVDYRLVLVDVDDGTRWNLPDISSSVPNITVGELDPIPDSDVSTSTQLLMLNSNGEEQVGSVGQIVDQLSVDIVANDDLESIESSDFIAVIDESDGSKIKGISEENLFSREKSELALGDRVAIIDTADGNKMKSVPTDLFTLISGDPSEGVFNVGPMQFRFGQFVSNTDNELPVNFAEPFSNKCSGVWLNQDIQNEKVGFSAAQLTVNGFLSDRNSDVSGTVTVQYFAAGY